MIARSTFGQRIRAAKPRDKYYDLWDETVPGLGLRIGPSGQRSFFLRRKLPTGKVRSVTLGSADRMSVADARRVLATLLDVPEEECGPSHPGRPMAEFAEEFLERYARHWKPNTLESSAMRCASTSSRRSAISPSTRSRSSTCGTGSPP